MPLLRRILQPDKEFRTRNMRLPNRRAEPQPRPRRKLNLRPAPLAPKRDPKKQPLSSRPTRSNASDRQTKIRFRPPDDKHLVKDTVVRLRRRRDDLRKGLRHLRQTKRPRGNPHPSPHSITRRPAKRRRPIHLAKGPRTNQTGRKRRRRGPLHLSLPKRSRRRSHKRKLLQPPNRPDRQNTKLNRRRLQTIQPQTLQIRTNDPTTKQNMDPFPNPRRPNRGSTPKPNK